VGPPKWSYTSYGCARALGKGKNKVGQGIEPVRVIRDEIKKRVEQLLAELLP